MGSFNPGPNNLMREFYVGFSSMSFGSSVNNNGNNVLDESDLGLEAGEETYTSSLFQTEPLYQFYDTNKARPFLYSNLISPFFRP